MSTLTTNYGPLLEDYPKPDTKRAVKPGRPSIGSPLTEQLRPNTLVRWVFFVSVFCIPFTRLYLPGTGNTVGVTRLVQALIVAGVLSQPRVCLRLMPVALFW